MWWDMWHLQGKREMHAEFQWGNLKEREHQEYLDLNGIIVLNWITKNENGLYLAHYREKGKAVLDTVVKNGIP